MLKTFYLLFSCILLITPSVVGDGIISGAGASFPYPLYSAWAFDYKNETGIKINYQSIGSGGGVRQISSRTIDFGASDDPLDQQEQKEKKLLQFPAIIGGVVPVVNLKNIRKGDLKLTPNLLAMIFLGKIEKWNDTRIRSINQQVKLPDKNIIPVHRSDGSGTTAIFTTYLSKVNSEWNHKVGKGKLVKWPVGIAGKGNEGVSAYVKRLENTIGYVEFAYAKNSQLSYVRLQNREGTFVMPSFDSFEAAAAHGTWKQSNGYNVWLVDSPGKSAWPLIGASFILLAQERLEANREVTRFFDWVFENGDSTARKLTYIPLPESLKNDIRSYWIQNEIFKGGDL